jgi:hypothetical protein
MDFDQAVIVIAERMTDLRTEVLFKPVELKRILGLEIKIASIKKNNL